MFKGQEVIGKILSNWQTKVQIRSNTSQPEHRTFDPLAAQDITVPRTTARGFQASHCRQEKNRKSLFLEDCIRSEPHTTRTKFRHRLEASLAQHNSDSKTKEKTKEAQWPQNPWKSPHNPPPRHQHPKPAKSDPTPPQNPNNNNPPKPSPSETPLGPISACNSFNPLKLPASSMPSQLISRSPRLCTSSWVFMARRCRWMCLSSKGAKSGLECLLKTAVRLWRLWEDGLGGLARDGG